MWPKSCISVAISWPQFCPNHLCLRWPLPAWPGPIENTFYTITNCNEIDLSRTTARRSRNPHKFWHTRSEMEAGRSWLLGFLARPAICHSFWPTPSTIYIHIRLITGWPYQPPILTGWLPCSGILFNAFKYMNYAHCTLAQTSLLVVVWVCVSRLVHILLSAALNFIKYVWVVQKVFIFRRLLADAHKVCGVIG